MSLIYNFKIEAIFVSNYEYNISLLNIYLLALHTMIILTTGIRGIILTTVIIYWLDLLMWLLFNISWNFAYSKGLWIKPNDSRIHTWIDMLISSIIWTLTKLKNTIVISYLNLRSHCLYIMWKFSTWCLLLGNEFNTSHRWP